jgi:hypothetical protein
MWAANRLRVPVELNVYEAVEDHKVGLRMVTFISMPRQLDGFETKASRLPLGYGKSLGPAGLRSCLVPCQRGCQLGMGRGGGQLKASSERQKSSSASSLPVSCVLSWKGPGQERHTGFPCAVGVVARTVTVHGFQGLPEPFIPGWHRLTERGVWPSAGLPCGAGGTQFRPFLSVCLSRDKETGTGARRGP